MTELALHRTDQLARSERDALRHFLADCFSDDYTDADFDHALGGVHALVVDDDRWVAHGAVVARRLRYDGRTLRTGYVESVAVCPDRRHQGLGDLVMGALETVIRSGFDLGALAASEDGLHLYRRRGWLPWTGPLFAVTPDGTTPTGDDDAVFVLPGTAPVDPARPLTCDRRTGSPW